MRVQFNEVSVKATRKWIDESGVKRQKTKKFWQTINPFNRNPDGSVKTREQIMEELVKERDVWINSVSESA